MKHAPAPTASDQRGPKWLATQPTIGAPIVVPPSATPTRSAITLPRMDGSVESCMMLFVPLVKVRAAAPLTARAAANHQYPGASAARVQPSPKTPAPIDRDAKPGFFRPAANNAPESEPTAMMEESRPKARASQWKTFTAIVEMKIGKFSPKVPIRNNMTRIALRSGLFHT